MTTCYIGIGSNLGDRQLYIDHAIDRIRHSPDMILSRVSSIYETDPVGGVPQGKFLNGVMEIGTDLSPKALLKELNVIEDALWRERPIKGGPRTIDLDILYYGEVRVSDEALVIPHPRIKEREFVLKGLRELNVGEI